MKAEQVCNEAREIKDTMEIAESMKPLNTQVGRKVRKDK